MVKMKPLAGSMGAWRLGGVELGTLEHWNAGTLELWNIGTLEQWNAGTRYPSFLHRRNIMVEMDKQTTIFPSR